MPACAGMTELECAAKLIAAWLGRGCGRFFSGLSAAAGSKLPAYKSGAMAGCAAAVALFAFRFCRCVACCARSLAGRECVGIAGRQPIAVTPTKAGVQ